MGPKLRNKNSLGYKKYENTHKGTFKNGYLLSELSIKEEDNNVEVKPFGRELHGRF